MHDMLTTLKLLNIRQRLMLHKSVLVCKIVNSITPQYMANVTVGITHNYNTRSKSNANLSRSHNRHVKSLSAKGTILWNSLPSNVKNQTTITYFKRYCTKYIIGSVNQ